MGWGEYILAYVMFFASHRLPLLSSLKPYFISVLGQTGFTLVYSVLSVAILYWLILAAGRAPYVALWDWEPWQNTVPLILMLPCFLLISISLARPNPFSFGGINNDQFDPNRPGVIRIFRHPLLVALTIWTLSHIVPNGNLAHVILFASFALFALAGIRIIDLRKQRELGEAWHSTWHVVCSQPIIQWPSSMSTLLLRFGLGCVAYVSFLALHAWLFGVSPLI